MDFLQTADTQILVGAAVALVAIGAGAFYFYSSKKPKGLTFNFELGFWNMLKFAACILQRWSN
jgi:hypothetical protein